MNNLISASLSKKTIRTLRGIYNELSNYDVMYGITTSTPLTYPDLKFIREMILEVCGMGKCYRCPEAHSAQDIASMLSDKHIRSELYKNTGLDYNDLDILREQLDMCGSYFLPLRMPDQYESMFEVDFLYSGNKKLDMLDMLISFKPNILFGWHEKPLSYQDIGESGKELSSGFHAVSLFLVCSADSLERLDEVKSGVLRMLNNDLGNSSSMCLGQKMSHQQERKISCGYDPFLVVPPIFIKDSDWNDCLYPALMKFERYTCL